MNYDEALELAINWKAITGQPMADEIIEALQHAKKQDELLGLYREWHEMMATRDDDVIFKKIKALEKEMKGE